MWILVVAMLGTGFWGPDGVAVTTIPGWKTEKECLDAGQKLDKKMDNVLVRYTCIELK
jgi:hypothetical protein